MTVIHTFQCNHFTRRIHDGRIGTDWTTNWITAIVHIDDDHLSRIGHLLSDADKFVRFHGERAKRNRVRIDADICELQIENEKEKSNIKIGDENERNRS